MYAEIDGRGGRLKGMLRRADAMGSRLCALIGDGELERGVLTLKDLAGHTQEEIPLDGAAHAIADRLASPISGSAR